MYIDILKYIEGFLWSVKTSISLLGSAKMHPSDRLLGKPHEDPKPFVAANPANRQAEIGFKRNVHMVHI